jgi:hypothetical protein
LKLKFERQNRNRKEYLAEKIRESSPGLTGPSQPNPHGPTMTGPHTPSSYRLPRDEAARWSSARRLIHRRRFDTLDEGRRPPTSISRPLPPPENPFSLSLFSASTPQTLALFECLAIIRGCPKSHRDAQSSASMPRISWRDESRRGGFHRPKSAIPIHNTSPEFMAVRPTPSIIGLAELSISSLVSIAISLASYCIA